jgi:predicted nuclease of predicted toxin-antitoxin system
VTLWIDNQLPPALASWMSATFSIDCLPVRDRNLQRATDPAIFAAARGANVIVLTKDTDFVELLDKMGHRRKWSWSRAAIHRTRACDDSCR